MNKQIFWNSNNNASYIFSFKEMITAKKYTIPKFQRMYDWNDEEIERLLDDIKFSIKNGNYWFISFFLISEVKDEKYKNNFFYLVDGQQRFTTIFLFLIHTKNILEKKDKIFFEKLINDLDRLLCDKSSDNFKLRLDIPKSGKFLEDIYNDKINEDKIKNGFQKKLIENSNLIKEKIEKYISNLSNDEIEKFVDYLSNTELALIKLGKNGDETLIFESLNSKGKTLTFVDLINNYFYSQKRKNYNDFDFEDETLSQLIEFIIFNDNYNNFNWKTIFYKNSSFLNNFIDIYISNLVDLDGKIKRYKKMSDIEKFNYFIKNKKEQNVNYYYEYMLKIRGIYIYFLDKMGVLLTEDEIDPKNHYLSKLSFILTTKEALPLFFYLIINSKECKFDINLNVKEIDNIEKIVNFFEKLILTLHIADPSKWSLLKTKIHYFIQKEKKISNMNFDEIIIEMKNSKIFKIPSISNRELKLKLRDLDFYNNNFSNYLFLELENELRLKKQKDLKNYMYKLYTDYENNLKIKGKIKIDYVFSVERIYPKINWNKNKLEENLGIKQDYLGNITLSINKMTQNKFGLEKKKDYRISNVLLQQEIAKKNFPENEFSNENKEEYKKFFDNIFNFNYNLIKEKLIKEFIKNYDENYKNDIDDDVIINLENWKA